jgi:hypothetical protein
MLHDSVHNELVELAFAVCDGTASDAQLDQVEEFLAADPAARLLYLQCLELHFEMDRRTGCRQRAAGDGRKCPRTRSFGAASGEKTAEDGILGPDHPGLEDADSQYLHIPPAVRPFNPGHAPIAPVHGVFAYLSSGWPAAYLVATVICGVAALIGASTYVSWPNGDAKQRSVIAEGRVTSPQQDAFVAKITGIVDCEWVDSSNSPTSRRAAIGQKYSLASGLMEVTFDTGARVILQGPTTFEIQSANSGYLSFGKLTGKVEVDAAKGFAIRTPTAVVTDLGTEFGVEVDGQGATTSHVFRGSVRMQTLGGDAKKSRDAKVLHANETARVERNNASNIVLLEPSSERADYVRSLPNRAVTKVFDLADAVAGGDGFSGLRGRGINPANGQPTESALQGARNANPEDCSDFRVAGDGKYHRVESLLYIDGVFIPANRSGGMQIDSAGHTFDGFGNSSNQTAANIWAGGKIPVPTASMPSWISSVLTPLSSTTTLLPTKVGDIDYAGAGHGLIFLHANCGITFDLDAIRRNHPDLRLARFRAVAGNTEPMSGKELTAASADLWLLIDGELRYRRREISGCSGSYPISLPIRPNDRFLTLVATDAGNDIGGDWILFGDPVLEFLPIAATNQTKSQSK